MAKRGGSSKGGAAAKQTSTPSGITYDEFMKMSVEQREQAIIDILNDENITIPGYLDQTATQKVIYALGMDGKPQVLSDTQLDKLEGKDLFRTVNDNKYFNGNEILDQIVKGDYTRLSDSGGSAYGRGIYFANDLSGSLVYGDKGKASVLRMKLTEDANIVTYKELGNNLYGSSLAKRFEKGVAWGKAPSLDSGDYMALRAISQGIDGWFDPGSGYYIMLNRSKMVVSKKYKRFNNSNTWHADWKTLN